MAIKVVSRKTGICPFCGTQLIATRNTIEEFPMTPGGYIMKRTGVKQFIIAKCNKCGFKTKMEFTIEGALSPNGKAPNEPTLEIPNSIGKVED